MSELADVSRAAFYRFAPNEKGNADIGLRDAMQRIALKFPSYGWRRMTAELKRRGWAVNHKRVYRPMHEDNLLCLRRPKFIVTSDRITRSGISGCGSEPARHGCERAVGGRYYVHPLAVRVGFLAAILDAFSRRAIGWALGAR
jgi:putative transposase